jgi:HD-GYP domain-containing protein (c-di-GMP phosphodiesterase class II)
MRKVYIEQLQEGMVVARAVHNDRGDILLARGVRLTSRYINALKTLGFYAIFVRDGIGDDLEPPEVISEQVRVATYKHVRDLFAVVQNAVYQSAEEPRHSALAQIGDRAAPQVAQLYRDVERIVDEVMTADTLSGVASLKTHDNYTFEHSVEVTVAGVLLGKRLYLPMQDLHQLALGCLCHDIGKISVPAEILGKPGRLTEEEFALVKQHPAVGYEAVQQFMGDSDIVARHVVWQHHERQDGNGYPRGLKGDNRFSVAVESRFGKRMILPAAEIAAVADVYSALASDRPYRRALKPPEIVATLRELAGTHLNSELVRRFLSILPAYPVGTEVVVISEKLRGHRGVVTSTPSVNIHRPTIRIQFDQYGRKIPPFEVDTAVEKEIELAVPSYEEAVPSYEAVR